VAETAIAFDCTTTLPAVPTGIALEAIIVKIELEPPSGGCIIYGWGQDKNLRMATVHSSQEKLRLPFAHPQIWLKYIDGAKGHRLTILGWEDSRKDMPFVPPTLPV